MVPGKSLSAWGTFTVHRDQESEDRKIDVFTSHIMGELEDEKYVNTENGREDKL